MVNNRPIPIIVVPNPLLHLLYLCILLELEFSLSIRVVKYVNIRFVGLRIDGWICLVLVKEKYRRKQTEKTSFERQSSLEGSETKTSMRSVGQG